MRDVGNRLLRINSQRKESYAKAEAKWAVEGA